MSEFSRPRHRRPPTVSAHPPQRSRPEPAGRSIIAGEHGRVVAVFGPPGVGVSTILRCLGEAAGVRVLQPDYDDLADQAKAQEGAEVLLIDGYPHAGLNEHDEPAGPRAIQYLYDRRLVTAGSGAIVRVMSDPEVLIQKGRTTLEGYRAWVRGLPPLEARMRLLDMPHFAIHNEEGEEGLLKAVEDLAARLQLKIHD